MRQLQAQEVHRVSGGIAVDVNVPNQTVKVTASALWGLITIPLFSLDWGKFGRK